ncbi:MAG: hercynine metabolism small protein [Cyanobacteriota bacterium]|nr:hercynine metabolism small protein [Cyanobacteriota bacterium]
MGRDDWSRADQRQAMRLAREGLIEELEALYLRAFERLSELDLGEGAIARLTQLLLRSREAALTPLREEIEAPLITQAPGERAPGERAPEEQP